MVYGTLAHAACDAKPAKQYDIKRDAVFDKTSHLTWQRCSVGQRWQEGAGCVGAVKPLTWQQAKQEENGGWRMPTRDELATLVSRACKPTIDDAAFPGLEADSLNYWSGTAASDSTAYFVNFENGVVSADALDEPYALRLVRGGK